MVEVKVTVDGKSVAALNKALTRMLIKLGTALPVCALTGLTLDELVIMGAEASYPEAQLGEHDECETCQLINDLKGDIGGKCPRCGEHGHDIVYECLGCALVFETPILEMFKKEAGLQEVINKATCSSQILPTDTPADTMIDRGKTVDPSSLERLAHMRGEVNRKPASTVYELETGEVRSKKHIPMRGDKHVADDVDPRPNAWDDDGSD